MASSEALQEYRDSVTNNRHADLSNANLSNANLRNVDLRDADLRNANLSNANLCHADLRHADLSDADLCHANLWGASISLTAFKNVKWGDEEDTAMKLLFNQLNKDQQQMYNEQGSFIFEDAIFSRDELVRTPKGIWCIEIKGECPPSDRILQRLLLYKSDKKKFYETAERQFNRGGE